MSAEWIRYQDRRIGPEGSRGACCRQGCSLPPEVLKYESDEADPVPMCGPHGRDDGWSGTALALSEAEMVVCSQFSGEPSKFTENYGSLQAGSKVTFVTQADEHDPGGERVTVKLTALIDGTTLFEGVSGNPPSRLFEGEVVSTTHFMFESGKQAFGILFPNGFASVVDGDPAGDYTDRRIAAALVVFGSEV